MKHMVRFESYSTQERLDDILDKISQYGMKSITKIEKEFLDAHHDEKQKEVHDRIKFIENEQVFEDDQGNFKFEFREIKKFKRETHYIGTLYVPELVLPNGKSIDGRIDGQIIDYGGGRYTVDFDKEGFDVFDFCSGIEYELDSFVDYVISELEKTEFEK